VSNVELKVSSGLKPLLSWKDPAGGGTCTVASVGISLLIPEQSQEIPVWGLGDDLLPPVRYGETREGDSSVFPPLVAGKSYVARIWTYIEVHDEHYNPHREQRVSDEVIFTATP
jgi:hypothetical protein